MGAILTVRANVSNIEPRETDSGGHTLEEIGLMLGITREAVRQIEQKALAKIRKALAKEPRLRDSLALEIGVNPDSISVELSPDGYFAPEVLPIGQGPQNAEQHHAYLVEVLRVLGPATFGDICSATNRYIPGAEIRGHLMRMEVLGIVEKARGAYGVKYHLCERWEPTEKGGGA